jgi:hypothetical protein
LACGFKSVTPTLLARFSRENGLRPAGGRRTESSRTVATPVGDPVVSVTLSGAIHQVASSVLTRTHGDSLSTSARPPSDPAGSRFETIGHSRHGRVAKRRRAGASPSNPRGRLRPPCSEIRRDRVGLAAPVESRRSDAPGRDPAAPPVQYNRGLRIGPGRCRWTFGPPGAGDGSSSYQRSSFSWHLPFQTRRHDVVEVGLHLSCKPLPRSWCGSGAIP